MQVLDLLFFVSMLGAGVYCLWLGFSMGRWTELKDSALLYPNGMGPKQCLDPEGFLDFMRARILIFGFLCLPAAAGLGLNSFLKLNLQWLLVGSIVLMLGNILFYSVSINQSYNRFFKI